MIYWSCVLNSQTKMTVDEDFTVASTSGANTVGAKCVYNVRIG